MKFDKSLGTAAFGEILGTAMLMFFGCGACTSKVLRSLLEISFAFGMAVAAAVQSFGCFSGAHINPSVTIANVLLGLMPWDLGLVYVLFQFLGALLGYGLLFLLLPSIITNDLCVTSLDRLRLTCCQAFCYEFVMTGALVLFCCSVWDKRNASHLDSVSIRFGLLIMGLVICGVSIVLVVILWSIVMGISFQGRQTGASINFARTLVPALFQGQYGDICIYLGAQVLASVVFALYWKFLMTDGGGSRATTRGE